MSITFQSVVCLIIIMFYSAHGLFNNNNNVFFSFRFMFFVSRSKSIISSSVADWRSCFPCMLDIFTMSEWKSDTKNLFSFEWSLTETLANHCFWFFFSGSVFLFQLAAVAPHVLPHHFKVSWSMRCMWSNWRRTWWRWWRHWWFSLLNPVTKVRHLARSQ